MTVLASLLTVVVLAIAVGVIGFSVKASGGKVVAALAGRSVRAASIAAEGSARPGTRFPVKRRRTAFNPANDSLSALPLAA